ncbi:hypothetical protein [uncultured Microscilla sp.]|nr:hypothetical protein [uncultured Microscilla sp.]
MKDFFSVAIATQKAMQITGGNGNNNCCDNGEIPPPAAMSFPFPLKNKKG